MVRVRTQREGSDVTDLFAGGIVICEVACLAWIFRRWANSGQQLRPKSSRTADRRADPPLIYTAEASAQRLRHGLNRELVETAIALPSSSGLVRGTEEQWFIRDLGSRRIRVWVSDSHLHRRRVVARIDVLTQAPP